MRYRVLQLSSTSGDLLTASQPIGSPRAEPNGYVPAALVTPDGRTVITTEVVPYTHLLFVHGAMARIVELNARTGHLERTLYSASAAGQSDNLDQACNVLSLGPGGRHPLVDCFSKLGALVDGQIVSLPGFPAHPAAAFQVSRPSPGRTSQTAASGNRLDKGVRPEASSESRPPR